MNNRRTSPEIIGASLLFGVFSVFTGVMLLFRGAGNGGVVLVDVSIMATVGWLLMSWAEEKKKPFWTGLGISFAAGCLYSLLRTATIFHNTLSGMLLLIVVIWGIQAALGWLMARGALNLIAVAKRSTD